jgi:hypothetical protein
MDDEHAQRTLPRVYSLTELTGRRAQDERVIRLSANMGLHKREALYMLVALACASVGYLLGSLVASWAAVIVSAAAGSVSFVYLSAAENSSLRGRARAAVAARVKAKPGRIYQAGVEADVDRAPWGVLAHAAYMSQRARLTRPVPRPPRNTPAEGRLA